MFQHQPVSSSYYTTVMYNNNNLHFFKCRQTIFKYSIFSVHGKTIQKIAGYRRNNQTAAKDFISTKSIASILSELYIIFVQQMYKKL